MNWTTEAESNVECPKWTGAERFKWIEDAAARDEYRIISGD